MCVRALEVRNSRLIPCILPFAGSNLSFVGSTFSHNSAAFHGGGIMCIFGFAYVADSVIADNQCASAASNLITLYDSTGWCEG